MFKKRDSVTGIKIVGWLRKLAAETSRPVQIEITISFRRALKKIRTSASMAPWTENPDNVSV